MARPLLIVSRERRDIFQVLTRNAALVDDLEVILDRRRRSAPRRRARERRVHRVIRDLSALGFVIVRPVSPPVAPVLSGALRALNISAETVAFLGTLPPFRDFTPEQLSLLARRAKERRLAKGQVLFREGEPGGEMFIVRRGTILISKAIAGKAETVLRRLGPRDFFGEMSLLGGLPRTATAKAGTGAVVIGLDRDSLVHVIEMSSRAALSFFTSIVQQVSRRLATTENAIAEVTRWGFDPSGLRR